MAKQNKYNFSIYAVLSVRARRFSSSAALLVGAAAVLLTAGCRDQSFIKRDSNASRDYDYLYQGARPFAASFHRPPPPPPPPAPIDHTELCAEPFAMKIQDDEGNRLISFVEGQTKSYVITVYNRLDPNEEWGVAIFDDQKPIGSMLEPVSVPGKGKSEATYRFTWTPSVGQSASDQTQARSLNLKYYSNAIPSACGFPADRATPQNIRIVVKKSAQVPSIIISNLPSGIIPYSGKQLHFQIRIADPGATKDDVPELESPTFDSQLIGQNRELIDISWQNGAPKSVFCDVDHMTYDEKSRQHVAECVFDTKRVPGLKALLNSGKIVDAGFVVTATANHLHDKEPGLTSERTPVTFTLRFDKNQLSTSPALKGQGV